MMTGATNVQEKSEQGVRLWQLADRSDSVSGGGSSAHSAGQLRQRNEKLCQTAAEAACDSKATQYDSLPRARNGTKTNAANGNRCGVVS
jgi:hypothetical protein